MKKYFLLLIVLIPILSFSKGMWKVQNPLPTESYLFTVHAISEKRIIMGGLGGTLLLSEDAGETWEVRKFVDLIDIRKICFKDSLNGWLIDSEHIYQTVDGGSTWNEIHINTDIDLLSYFYEDIFCFQNRLYLFLKPRTAVLYELIGINSFVLESVNDGKTWKKQDQPIKGKFLCAHFVNENYGIIYTEVTVSMEEGYNIFYMTSNGGNTWIENKFPEQYFTTSIYFINENKGFIGKFRTEDGGKSWKNVFENLEESENINDIYFTNSLNGWAVSDSRIFQSNDSGESWKSVVKGKSGKLKDVFFTSSGTGWIVGGAGTIYRKNNDSIFWEFLSTGHRAYLRDVFFINEKKGWCVGDGGNVLYTENGGEKWVLQDVPVDSILFKVKFLNELDGWIAGNKILLHTNDGGKIWIVKNGLNERFVDIDFFDKKVGLLIDYYGTVYRTINGGVDWNLVGKLPSLSSISIVNDHEAWIGGWQGLGHTTERGETINWYKVPVFKKVLDIQFVDESTGYVLTEYGALFKTTNGGWDWNEIPRGRGVETGPIQAFHILDRDNGWIYWDYKGGWIKNVVTKKTLIESDLEHYKVPSIRAFSFVNQYLGWAIGGTTILKYTKTRKTPIINNNEQRIYTFPNPSREYLNISFTLLKEQFVKINVFNVLGEKVDTIYRGYLNEGKYIFNWLHNNCVSGIYLVTVKCDEFEQIQKCTLIH